MPRISRTCVCDPVVATRSTEWTHRSDRCVSDIANTARSDTHQVCPRSLPGSDPKRCAVCRVGQHVPSDSRHSGRRARPIWMPIFVHSRRSPRTVATRSTNAQIDDATGPVRTAGGHSRSRPHKRGASMCSHGTSKHPTTTRPTRAATHGTRTFVVRSLVRREPAVESQRERASQAIRSARRPGSCRPAHRSSPSLQRVCLRL